MEESKYTERLRLGQTDRLDTRLLKVLMRTLIMLIFNGVLRAQQHTGRIQDEMSPSGHD